MWHLNPESFFFEKQCLNARQLDILNTAHRWLYTSNFLQMFLFFYLYRYFKCLITFDEFRELWPLHRENSDVTSYSNMATLRWHFFTLWPLLLLLLRRSLNKVTLYLPLSFLTLEQNELPSLANNNKGTIYSEEAPWNKGNLCRNKQEV